MRRHVKTVAAPNESDTALTLALVLGLFGVLAAIGSTGWAATSTLFILAAVAGIGGLVIGNGTGNPRKLNKSDVNAAAKAPVAELVGSLHATGSAESTPGAGFNVNQFYRYPMNRVAAIFDDLAGVTAALPQLEQAGVRPGWSECAQRAGRSPSAEPSGRWTGPLGAGAAGAAARRGIRGGNAENSRFGPEKRSGHRLCAGSKRRRGTTCGQNPLPVRRSLHVQVPPLDH